MAASFSRLLTLCLTLLLCLSAQANLFAPKSTSRFVPVDQAFQFDFSQRGSTLTLNWQVRPGYYLYRQQIKITAQHAQVRRMRMNFTAKARFTVRQ